MKDLAIVFCEGKLNKTSRQCNGAVNILYTATKELASYINVPEVIINFQKTNLPQIVPMQVLIASS